MLNSSKKILIVGLLPPPVGGVTIHLQRLKHYLKKTNLTAEFFNYKKKSDYILVFKKYDIVHIHLSNKLFRFLFVSLFKLTSRRVIITFHGRYDFSNKFDRLSLKISDRSLILNQQSFNKAQLYSPKKAVLTSAFLPPIQLGQLSKELKDELKAFRKKFKYIFCMNASSLVLDKDGRDIYQGREIFDYFESKPEWGLVFSDPSKDYVGYKHCENVFFITKPHPFVDVLSFADVLLRFTTTDGDSLSIKEALYLKKNVIASDCVDRPQGVIKISSLDEIEQVLSLINQPVSVTIENAFDNLLMIYSSI